jgi:hypothetical protein
MRAYANLEDYADRRLEGKSLGRRAVVEIGGVRWRPHPGHTRVEYEFDPRIGYNVPVRESRHDGCLVDPWGRVYCPICRAILPVA